MLSKTSTGRIPISKATTRQTETKSKIVQPLGNKRHFTVFSSVYSKGGIPCRLDHGSVKHKIYFCEGLRESQHPFTFIVGRGLENMIDADGSKEKIIAIMPSVVGPLRNALGVKEKSLFLNALKIFVKLVVLLEDTMDSYLAAILPPIASKILASDSETRLAVHEALTAVQQYGGPQSLTIIRKKVPTYSPTI